jgi:hypothetical protein
MEEDFSPVDVDVNLVKSFLDFYSASVIEEMWFS